MGRPTGPCLPGSAGSHPTQIGHSYGSVLTGVAVRSGNLHVDDIVVVGSPGMTVASAKDLHLDPSRVWVAADPRDIVANPKRYGDMVVNAAPPPATRSLLSAERSAVRPARRSARTARTSTASPRRTPASGPTSSTPSRRKYDGPWCRAPVDTHGLYWEPGATSALEAQAKIVTGHGNQVRLDRTAN